MTTRLGMQERLADKLSEHFGKDQIFMDIDNIQPGEDFVQVIENAVGSCEILIAIIGRHWLSRAGETSRLLDNPNDFVRLEIAAALSRDIRVIPVLVQRAAMPKPQDLPEDLTQLSRRNALELTDNRWQRDVDQLIGVMESVLDKRADAARLVEAARLSEADRQRQEEEKKRLRAEEAAQRAAEERRLEENRELRKTEERARFEARIVAPPSPPDRSKRAMVIAIITSFVIIACGAAVAIGGLIWVAQTPEGEQQPANQNATPVSTEQTMSESSVSATPQVPSAAEIEAAREKDPAANKADMDSKFGTKTPPTSPRLTFTGQENFQANGMTLTRYSLSVTNRAAFPNEIFAPAPDLPPCGKNNNSSRTWVDIFDGAGKRVYGFCALKSADELAKLWFALPEEQAPPSSVFIVLTDRSSNAEYKSNIVLIP